MSVQARNQLSFKKQNVIEQNIPHVGVKNLTFAHEFVNSGESAILFNSLNTPSSWLESGLINPSGISIASAQLQVFKGNVSVISSARGAIQKSEYIVKNSGIFFKNITSLANEIFEVSVSDTMVTGKAIADMRTIRVEGSLLDGQTDFAIGYDVDVLNEELVVFRDGIQLFRSDDNDDSGSTGNYHYLDIGNTSRSSVIRFFEPAVDDEPILVISSGGIVDKANVSTFQQIENLAGQLDNIVPTVAALAGVPESNFRAAPNYVDLKQFGQRLIDVETEKADLNGNAAEIFSVANATSSSNAVNLGQFVSSLTTNGYQRFPGGLIVQWGTIAPASRSSEFDFGLVSFPISFPNACLNVAVTLLSPESVSLIDVMAAVRSFSVTNFNPVLASTILNTRNYGITWFAIGF